MGDIPACLIRRPGRIVFAVRSRMWRMASALLYIDRRVHRAAPVTKRTFERRSRQLENTPSRSRLGKPVILAVTLHKGLVSLALRACS